MSIVDNLEGDAMSSQQTALLFNTPSWSKTTNSPELSLDGGTSSEDGHIAWRTYLIKTAIFFIALSEEEQIPRQQIMSIIKNNAKYNALKFFCCYNDPYNS